ncbi:Uma2 family endonuclease [Metabacillus sp. KIGAM252]|uniref:Uma2 family endonuclease n=1 Tax=Metabacillus flavus TaxID=2823519 RepID=A0ABS5LAT0_9BACI|nr:Uma2 family endonuclease [Metabacillus flavus]
MSMPKENHVSIQEYYKRREQSDTLMEYINGVVYMTPSPSTAHQRISGRLFVQLYQLLEGEECEAFHAPFDIELSKEDISENKVVIPDLSVICDKSGLSESRYTGVPALIIEIISPSNQSHDLVTKLNLYMQYGVQEYWIVNPLIHTIHVYTLSDNKQYVQKDVVKEIGVIQSSLFEEFYVDAKFLFKQ